jgi:hypothetical protein
MDPETAARSWADTWSQHMSTASQGGEHVVGIVIVTVLVIIVVVFIVVCVIMGVNGDHGDNDQWGS